MTKKIEEYEFARKIMKKEKKAPSAYTPNRFEATVERVRKMEGDKAAVEFIKEWRSK